MSSLLEAGKSAAQAIDELITIARIKTYLYGRNIIFSFSLCSAQRHSNQSEALKRKAGA
jgi:hypothetical protein